MNVREILFQGKRLDNGEWVEGFYYEDIAGKSVILSKLFNFGYADAFVDRETVRQSTGLRDHTKWEDLTLAEQKHWIKKHDVSEWNGKRIFEGDIITIEQFDTKTKAIVRFGMHSQSMSEVQETSLGFFVDFGRDSWLRKDIGYWLRHTKVRVIGNIFDSSGLLCNI